MNRFEIITEYYEEKSTFKTLSLIPYGAENKFPTLATIELSDTIRHLCRTGTILRICNGEAFVVSNHTETENGMIKIGKKLFQKPICGTGFIIYNERGEIFLAKNASQGMLSFIYTVGHLVNHPETEPEPKDMELFQKAFRAMSVEDKQSIKMMVYDLEEAKKIFKCWLGNNKTFTNHQLIQDKIKMIAEIFQKDLDEEIEDTQECGFLNYSFIKGALNTRLLRNRTNNFKELQEYYIENSYIEFCQEMDNKRNDIEKVSKNDYIDFRQFSFETRDDFENIPLFQRFYIVKSSGANLKVKTREYNVETSKFYKRDEEKDTWLELPKFMREKVAACIDRLVPRAISVELPGINGLPIERAD